MDQIVWKDKRKKSKVTRYFFISPGDKAKLRPRKERKKEESFYPVTYNPSSGQCGCGVGCEVEVLREQGGSPS